LKHAQRKLASLLEERKRIDQRIVEWKRVADSLSVVSTDSAVSIPADLELASGLPQTLALGFTEAIRGVVEAAKHDITPKEVRDALVRLGFDLSKYAQQMVPIHNTLKRLVEQEEIIALRDAAGKTVGYRAVNPVAMALGLEGPSYGAPNSLANMMNRTRSNRFRKMARKLFSQEELNEP
jgi:hypothetical protein